MLRRFPLAAWITLSGSLVAAGAYVRFDGSYLVSDQLILGILFLMAALMLTVALICWLPLLRRIPDDRRPGRVVALFVLAPALSVGLLVSMAFESEAASAERQRVHLIRVARIIVDDYLDRGRMPVLFEDALNRSADQLPHRGDADGQALTYRRIDPHSALLCAPSCRVHVHIQGQTIHYQPWAKGQPDPCGDRSPAAYWAGSDPDPTSSQPASRPR